MQLLIVVVIAVIATILIHYLTEKNVGFSLLMFIACLSLGVIFSQPVGKTEIHKADDIIQKPSKAITIPCKDGHYEKYGWATTTTYTTVLGMMISKDSKNVIIYCPKDYNEETARKYVKKHSD
jgi:hypothetical protein